jgi:hypothetical protein
MGIRLRWCSKSANPRLARRQLGVFALWPHGADVAGAVPKLFAIRPLKLLDERVEATGLAYARFMGDWVILAPTRWKLREAIRVGNQTLAELHVEQHPHKTFIGRISRGFDHLGYAFKPAGLDTAPPTIERCAQRVSQRYKQGVNPLHIGAYVRRWLRWARSGLRALGARLSERALVLVLRSLGRLEWARWLPASAAPGDGGTNRRR